MGWLCGARPELSRNPIEIAQEMSYKQMKFGGYQNHFTDNLAKKGEKIELRICKLAK